MAEKLTKYHRLLQNVVSFINCHGCQKEKEEKEEIFEVEV